MRGKTKIDLLEQYGYGPKVMKRIRVCPSCKTIVTQEHTSCPECGMKLINKTLYDRYREQHLCCDQCGTVLAIDSRYCPHCGNPLYAKVVK